MKKVKKEYLDGEEHSVILGVRGEHLSINKRRGVKAEVVFTEMGSQNCASKASLGLRILLALVPFLY